MAVQATYRIRIEDRDEAQEHNVDFLALDLSFRDFLDGLRRENAIRRPSFLDDGRRWPRQTMLQRVGLGACYALDLSLTPRATRLDDGDELILRRAYATDALIAPYVRERGFISDASRAGLRPSLALEDLEPEDLALVGLRELHRQGFVADLTVLALQRFGVRNELRPLFEDVARDFSDPSLACPGCWPHLYRHHEELREAWRGLQ